MVASPRCARRTLAEAEAPQAQAGAEAHTAARGPVGRTEVRKSRALPVWLGAEVHTGARAPEEWKDVPVAEERTDDPAAEEPPEQARVGVPRTWRVAREQTKALKAEVSTAEALPETPGLGVGPMWRATQERAEVLTEAASTRALAEERPATSLQAGELRAGPRAEEWMLAVAATPLRTTRAVTRPVVGASSRGGPGQASGRWCCC